MLYPLTFRSIFKERVWGGRNLERLYGKPIPAGVPIGESWEITDRQGDVSVIANGPLAGRDLHWLMEHHREELLGSAAAANGRFPLLVKILDAHDTLSLQVHPPPSMAVQMQGEPKTEMWFIADARPAAALYVGLRQGVTRAEFERRLQDGSVAECFHRHEVRAGDAMFLPSGRVHAIGAGNVIFEIQQNSDTTYRVFDWNRAGLDGKPRELHVPQSLASIDFNDFEPALVPEDAVQRGAATVRLLAQCPHFTVEHFRLPGHASLGLPLKSLEVLAVLSGSISVRSATEEVALRAGQFCMVPASVAATVHALEDASYLCASPGVQRVGDKT